MVSVVNSTDLPAQADIRVSDQFRRPAATRHVSLDGHASRIVLLDDLIGASSAALVGGLEISYTGGAESLLFSGNVEDAAVGYSARLPLTMAMEEMAGLAPAPASQTCKVASAGLMVGAPDPMEGFPSTVKFLLYGYMHNTGMAPLTVHGLANYMYKSGPHSINLPDVTLAPGETRNLLLDKNVNLPFRDGMVNLAYSYDAQCGTVLLSAGSVDATGSYVFEVNPQVVAKSWGHTSHYWQVGLGTDTMYSVWNPTDQPEDLAVIIHYEPGGLYRYPLHLNANTSVMISILDIIRKAAPDADGGVMPIWTRTGSFTVQSRSPDLRDTSTFVVSGGIYNPIAGTCCPPYWTCNGATGANVLLAVFTVDVNGTQHETLYVTTNNGNQVNYSSSASWFASNVFSVQAGGLVTGLAPGNGSINASVANVPIYVAQFCGGQCPVGAQGGTSSGTVLAKCFAQLKYRPVNFIGVPTGQNHSFWWIQNSSATQYVTDAGPGGTCPFSCGFLVDYVVQGSVGHYLEDNPNAILAWDSGLLSSVCTGVTNLFNFAVGWPQTTYNYAIGTSPNSNTFAHWPGNAAPFSPTAPPNAPGW